MYISTTSLHWDLKQGHNNIKLSFLITLTTLNHNEHELLQPFEKQLVNLTHSNAKHKFKPLYHVYVE